VELWLIRHGETRQEYAFNPEKMTADPALSDRGVRQARALAARCRDIRFERVESSDLRRAVHTARILAEGRGIEVGLEPRFREIDMGALYRGASWSDYPKLRAQWEKHEEDLPYPEGECGWDVWDRCRAPLEALLQSTRERAALVCHGGIIRCMLCGLLGLPQQKRFLLGDPLENCSITVVAAKDDGRIRLHTFNDCAHLARIK